MKMFYKIISISSGSQSISRVPEFACYSINNLKLQCLVFTVSCLLFAIKVSENQEYQYTLQTSGRHRPPDPSNEMRKMNGSCMHVLLFLTFIHRSYLRQTNKAGNKQYQLTSQQLGISVACITRLHLDCFEALHFVLEVSVLTSDNRRSKEQLFDC